MATFVYDGHHDDGGGNLFAGKKFFFLQRVPTRQRWMDLVKANAGQIVKLEQQADLIIADHVRKDGPVGSVSWKFIEESVKAGELKDIKSYPAGPSTHTPRCVGSNQPTKKNRTFFTNEDDRVLAAWVLEAERKGEPTRGNPLFKRLEEENNRHTWQSWRDRWVKYVSRRPQPNSEDSLPAPDRPRPVGRGDGSDQKPALRSKVPNGRAPSPQMSVESDSPARSHRSWLSASRSTTGSMADVDIEYARPYLTRSPGGTDFTDEEIKLLFDEATDIKKIDKGRIIDAWIAWATKYPNHTAQEWRNCYEEVVAPRIGETTKEYVEKATYSGPKSKRVSAVTPSSGSSDQESYERSTDPNISLAASEAPASQPATENAGQVLMREKEFRKELTGIAKGLNITLDFNPVICGRTVPIYRLWKTVWSDEFGGFNEVTRKRLWPRVARELNFNDYRHPNAAEELESCYRNILQPFDAGQEAYETTELSKSEEQQMIEAQLLGTAVHETQNPAAAFLDDKVGEILEFDDNVNTRSSLPRRHTLIYPGKRRLDTSHSNQKVSSQARFSNKRQRTDKGNVKELEIPSTPEPEPTAEKDQLPPSSGRTSQLEDAGLNELEEESEAELFVKQFKQVSRPSPAVRQTTEPETQDFYYPPDQFDETESLSLRSPPHKKSTRNKSKKSNTRNDNRSPAARPKPLRDASAQSHTDTQPTRELDLPSFMKHYMSLGHSGAHIIQALEATTMNTENASIVMEGLRSDNRIPRDIQGVWTSSDDEAVEKKNHPKFKDVLKKHGESTVDLRRRFLVDQRAARKQLSRGR